MNYAWKYWETEEHLSRWYSDGVAQMQIQDLLKNNNFLGIPFSSGGQCGYTVGIDVYRRSDNDTLARIWEEDGELFAEVANSECDHWQVEAKGTSIEEASSHLLQAVVTFIAEGEPNAEAFALQQGIDLQKLTVLREQRTLAEMEARLCRVKTDWLNKAKK